MHIFNVRLGFANNSSSSHSIIILPKNKKAKTSSDAASGDFGWGFFTAADEKSKKNYFAINLYNNLESIFGAEIAKKMCEDIFGTVPNGYVDHQSVLSFPLSFDRKSVNLNFMQDLNKYLEDNNVVICGGNDNTAEEHPLIKTGKESKLSILKTVGSLIARKSKIGDFYTFFNPANGAKLRFSLNQDIIPEKDLVPELVDVKITDFCPFNCAFCYQNSTLNGKHADLKFLEQVANELAKNEVFEVALGGGETTLHPQFPQVVKMFAEKNITVNFTTKNLSWLKKPWAKDVLSQIGSFAYSISSSEDISYLNSEYNNFKNKHNDVLANDTYYHDSRNKINAQLVMGTVNEEEFEKILATAAQNSISITLLGYKKNGRGDSYSPYDYQNWFDIVKKIEKKYGYFKVGVDTALATEFKDILAKNVKKELYHLQEGGFSMYIDAVQQTMAPSSYVGLEKSKPFDEQWINNFSDMLTMPNNHKKDFKIKVAF